MGMPMIVWPFRSPEGRIRWTLWVRVGPASWWRLGFHGGLAVFPQGTMGHSSLHGVTQQPAVSTKWTVQVGSCVAQCVLRPRRMLSKTMGREKKIAFACS